jgi:hypothetical protein
MKIRIPRRFSNPRWNRGAAAQIINNSATPHVGTGRQRGFLEVDLAVGLAILALAIVPLGYAFARERQALKIEYCRSVANEIVDGEMEILAAGAGKNLPDGVQNYPVHANAAASLPPGHFQLTKTGNHLRLEWTPDGKHGVGTVARETSLP